MGDEKPVARKRGLVRKAIIAAALLALLAGVGVWLSRTPGRTVFPMKEIPTPDEMTATVMAQSCEGPSGAVKRYPNFVSAAPICGKFFVKDHDRMNRPDAGYFFAIDESKGTGTGYDTLYLDTNRNLDLTDDKAAKSHPSPPGFGGQLFFDSVTIPGAGENGADVAVAPRMRSSTGGGAAYVCFVPAFARQGRVRIGGWTYMVTLVRADRWSQRYDQTKTAVWLFRPESVLKLGGETLWRASPEERLYTRVSGMFFAQGAWYSLSTTAAGDVLRVYKYGGDLGALKVSHGGMTEGSFVYHGTLHASDGSVVFLPEADSFVGRTTGGGAPARKILLPSGDYYVPDLIQVRVGDFSLMVQDIPSTYRPAGSDAPKFFLQVRKDRPCVIDIPSSADIVWLGRQKPTLKPGDTIDAAPRLVIPDFLVQDLSYAPPGPYRGPMRQLWSVVKIEDSAGKTLAEGQAVFDYAWKIPADFKPRSGRETLKVTATWDTGALFGVVAGTKDIIVESTDAVGKN